MFAICLVVKLIISIAFAGVYSTYYAHSDTTNYYEGGSILWELINDKEYTQAREYIQAKDLGSDYIPYIGEAPKRGILRSPVTFFMLKITAFFQLFTFNSFFATSLLFAFFTFLAALRLYSVIVEEFSDSAIPILLALFFFPTVLFWTSGIMKDTVILFSACIVVSSFYEIIMQRKRFLLNIILIVFCSFLIFQLRAVVLLVLLATMALWALMCIVMKVKSLQGRIILYPALFGSVLIGLVGVYYFGELVLGEYSFSFLFDTAVKFQLWHTYLSDMGKVGSGYNLTELTLTPLGIITVFFESLNVALFRPYIWEADNPFMVFASFESLALLIISLFVFLKVGIIRSVKRIFSHPFLVFTFVFSILFLAIVGFISYNFGALVRYKAIGSLFYGLTLALVYTWNDSYNYSN